MPPPLPRRRSRGRDLQETAAFDPKLHSAGPGEASATATVDLPKLGEYQLLEKLGEGGMGTVYKALHTKLDRLVALKVLPKGRLEDAQADRPLRAGNEGRRAGGPSATSSGPTTPARSTARRFLVMEYVEGLDLAQVVRRCGPLRVADACEVGPPGGARACSAPTSTAWSIATSSRRT